MNDGEDVRDHLRKFFNTIDKLSEMNVDINADLLTIMLLYSLPTSLIISGALLSRVMNCRHLRFCS